LADTHFYSLTPGILRTNAALYAWTTQEIRAGSQPFSNILEELYCLQSKSASPGKCALASEKLFTSDGKGNACELSPFTCLFI